MRSFDMMPSWVGSFVVRQKFVRNPNPIYSRTVDGGFGEFIPPVAEIHWNRLKSIE